MTHRSAEKALIETLAELEGKDVNTETLLLDGRRLLSAAHEAKLSTAHEANWKMLRSRFWAVFVAVFVLTLLSGVMSTYFSVWPANNVSNSLSEKLQAIFTLGCGSMIGMLGGKKLR